MSRKKKPEPLDPFAVMNNMDFDSLEEKIRGEQMLIDAETRTVREDRDAQKKLDKFEVDRKLEEMKKKIRPKK